jgi:hypothetical protein
METGCRDTHDSFEQFDPSTKEDATELPARTRQFGPPSTSSTRTTAAQPHFSRATTMPHLHGCRPSSRPFTWTNALGAERTPSEAKANPLPDVVHAHAPRSNPQAVPVTRSETAKIEDAEPVARWHSTATKGVATDGEPPDTRTLRCWRRTIYGSLTLMVETGDASSMSLPWKSCRRHSGTHALQLYIGVKSGAHPHPRVSSSRSLDSFILHLEG